MAFAYDYARPERREIKKATSERSVGNLCGCISMYKASWRRKPPHSAASPAYAAGKAMGLAEADWGDGGGWSEVRRVVISSSRATDGTEGRDPWGSDGVGPVFCHKQITERQVSGKTEGLLVMQNCEGDRSRCVAWWGIQSRVVWRCVNQSSFLRRSWSWELYLRRSRSWEFYLRRSRSWETQGNRTHTQEDRWIGFWETTVQVSSSNERKVSQVLFRVVNRRPDDECQRACGIYGCAD